jgi:ATP-dependent DNA helicase RecG
MWWLALIDAIAFVGTFFTARALSRRFLRNYFALTSVRVPDLAEACRCGEGQNVEFKRGLLEDEAKTTSVEDELLRSITAFANTNDGAIFIGVDDSGNIRGVKLDFNQKDRLERKIRQLTRSRIRPTPPIQVAFEEVRGLVVAKIAVARGEAPAYLLNGVIYVRDGSSDVQAQPEHLSKLIAEFAS